MIAGFGLGGLAAFAVIAASNWAVFVPQRGVAGHVLASPSASAAASAEPTTITEQSPSPPPAQTAGGPGPRAGAAMVYDPESQGMILYGGVTTVPQADGHNESQTLGDTWLWDGTRWRQLNVPGPPARSDAMIAYDSARHLVVLFGGSGPGGTGMGLYFQDTWTWDGKQWQVQRPAHAPEPRMRAALAFDERRGVAVMFGGEGETTTYTATWTWDGADWTLRDPATSPTPRTFAGMAYDQARGVTVLLGGSWAGKHLSDTWTWDGTTWTQQPGSAPAAGWTQLAYDAATQQVVGYVYSPAGAYTITWDGSAWSDRTSGQQPSVRAETAIAYDSSTHAVLLYGGSFTDPMPYSDTWGWNGTGWSLSGLGAGA